MVQFPNCKINIGLYIERKRDDGFHDIKTVFYPVKFNDTLEVKKAEGNFTSMEIFGLPIEGEISNNLCIKAYNLLHRDFSLPPVKIELLKKIPTGAGLGGGSSDAVSTLKILNEIFELNLSKNQLYKYANKLGSDCAFFIENKPLLASGRGDVLREIDFSLKGYSIVLMKPNIKVDTSWAYKLIKPRNTSSDLLNLIKSPAENWKNSISNDFEEVVFKYFPVIGNLKEMLYSKGAIYASMSGSGSAVFGIFNKIPKKIALERDFLWKGECLL